MFLSGGVVAFAIPQILSNRGVPETSIAGITAAAFSPGFWAFVFSPMLDVRFSRRWYALVLALVSAFTLVVGFMNLDKLILLEVILTIGFCAAILYQGALGGWLSTITSASEKKALSAWITIGNLGGFGIMAVGCDQIVRRFPPLAVALIISMSIILPTLVFPFMPAPGPHRRLAGESFSQVFRDIVSLVKRGEILIAIILFVAPAGTFSLTNFLGSRGGDFHASPGFVGLVGGLGVSIAALTGCLAFPPLSRLMPLRRLYLTIGFVGGLITLSLILLPRTPASFAIVLLTENVLQSVAITCCMAVAFETIGRDNPLASTILCFIGSAFGLPISYMLYVDAFGFTLGGISGSFAMDAIAGILACLILAGMLFWLGRDNPQSASQA